MHRTAEGENRTRRARRRLSVVLFASSVVMGCLTECMAGCTAVLDAGDDELGSGSPTRDPRAEGHGPEAGGAEAASAPAVHAADAANAPREDALGTSVDAGADRASSEEASDAADSEGALSRCASNVYAGAGRICVETDGGDLYCWGYDGEGALGTGFIVSAIRGPVLASALPPPRQGTDLGEDTCTWAGASLRCVGLYTRVEPTADRVHATPLTESFPSRIIEAKNGEAQRCTVLEGGALECRFLGSAVQDEGQAQNFTAVAHVASYFRHTCAIREDGSVWCWGWNAQGQCGELTGGVAPRRTTAPRRVEGLPLIATAIAAGRYHTCIIDSSGAVWCWGMAALASTDPVARDDAGAAPVPPTAVRGIPSKVRSIVTGDAFTCALTMNGDVYCWGEDRGQLGSGEPDVPRYAGPIRVASLPRPATDIAAGSWFACARLDDGTVRCWGARKESAFSPASFPCP